MTRNLTSNQNPIKRLHTRDRRRGYQTPSDMDVVCPHFQHTWAYLKDKGMHPDYLPMCENHTALCDYRNTMVPNQFSVCNRYWKAGNEGFEEVDRSTEFELPRQEINLQYDMIRLFRNKEATIKMTLNHKTLGYYYWFKEFRERFTMDPDGLFPHHSEDRTHVTSNDNQNYLAGYYNKASLDLSEYAFRTYFQNHSTDDDDIVFIFRYNPETKHYYAVHWNHGGMEPKGLSVQKHICLDPDTMEYETEILYHDDTFYYSPHVLHYYGGTIYNPYNYIEIDVQKERVSVYAWRRRYVWYEPHRHYHIVPELRRFSVNLDDGRIDKGAYGFGTISQPGVRFYNLYGQMEYVVANKTYTKVIPLSPLLDDGNGKILSESMNEYFQEERERYLQKHSINGEDLHTELYEVIYSNVSEGITFLDGSTSTSDRNEKLKISEWSYNTPFSYTKQLIVNTNDEATIKDVYHVDKDLYLLRTHIQFVQPILPDAYTIFSDHTKLHEGNVTNLEYEQEYEYDVHPLSNTDIVFEYLVNRNPIQYFHNENHIDTHNKIFKIKNGVLGWHATEVTYDD